MSLKKMDSSSTRTPTTEEIHYAFRDALIGFTIKQVKDKDLAEDLVQDTLLKIHQNIESLEDVNKITSWVFSITRNVIRDHFRKKKPIYNSESIEEFDLNHDLNEHSPAPTFLAMSGCIEDMVQKLPTKYQEALTLCDLLKTSQKEASLGLGISVEALKSRLHRGRQLLKQMMGDCCKKEVSKNCQSKETSSSCGCQDYNEPG